MKAWCESFKRVFMQVEERHEEEMMRIKKECYYSTIYFYDIMVVVYLLLLVAVGSRGASEMQVQKTVVIMYSLKFVSNFFHSRIELLIEFLFHLALSLTLCTAAVRDQLELSDNRRFPTDLLFFTMLKLGFLVSKNLRVCTLLVCFAAGMAYWSGAFSYITQVSNISLNVKQEEVKCDWDDEMKSVLGYRSSELISWTYYAVSSLIMLVQSEYCKTNYLRQIQNKMLELEVWRTFLLERTQQPLIGTVSFERNNMSKLTTINTFGIKNNADLLSVVNSMELCKINNRYQEVVDEQQAKQRMLEVVMEDTNRWRRGEEVNKNISKMHCKLKQEDCGRLSS